MSSTYPGPYDYNFGSNPRQSNIETSNTLLHNNSPDVELEMQRYYTGQAGAREPWDPSSAGYNSTCVSEAVRRQYMQQYSSQAAFNTQPSQPAFSTQPSQPAFSTQPSQPAFSTQPSQPAFSTHQSQASFSTQSQPAFPMNSLWSPSSTTPDIHQQRLQQHQQLHPTHELILHQQQQLQHLQQAQHVPQYPPQHQYQYNPSSSEYHTQQWNNVYNSQLSTPYSSTEKKAKQCTQPYTVTEKKSQPKRQDKRSNESAPDQTLLATPSYRHPHILPMEHQCEGAQFPNNVLHNGYTIYPNPTPRTSTMYPFSVLNDTVLHPLEQEQIPEAMPRRVSQQNGVASPSQSRDISAPLPHSSRDIGAPLPSPTQSRDILTESSHNYQGQTNSPLVRHPSTGHSSSGNSFLHQPSSGSPNHVIQNVSSPKNHLHPDPPYNPPPTSDPPKPVIESPKTKHYQPGYYQQSMTLNQPITAQDIGHVTLNQPIVSQDTGDVTTLHQLQCSAPLEPALKKTECASPKPPLPYSTISIRNCRHGKEHRVRAKDTMPPLDHSPKPMTAQNTGHTVLNQPIIVQKIGQTTLNQPITAQDTSHATSLHQPIKPAIFIQQMSRDPSLPTLNTLNQPVTTEYPGHVTLTQPATALPRMPHLLPMPILKPRPDLKDVKQSEGTDLKDDKQSEGTDIKDVKQSDKETRGTKREEEMNETRLEEEEEEEEEEEDEEEEESKETVSLYLNQSEETISPYLKLWSDINDDEVESHDLTIEIEIPKQKKKEEEEGQEEEGFDETCLPDLFIEVEKEEEEKEQDAERVADICVDEKKENEEVSVTQTMPEEPSVTGTMSGEPSVTGTMSGDSELLQFANFVDQLQPMSRYFNEKTNLITNDNLNDKILGEVTNEVDTEQVEKEGTSTSEEDHGTSEEDHRTSKEEHRRIDNPKTSEELRTSKEAHRTLEDHTIVDLLQKAKEKINQEESEEEDIPSPPPTSGISPEPAITEDIVEAVEEQEEHCILDSSEDETCDITKCVEIVLGIKHNTVKGSESAEEKYMEVAVQQKPMLATSPNYSQCNSNDDQVPVSSENGQAPSSEVTRYISVKDLVYMPVPDYPKTTTPSLMEGVEESESSAKVEAPVAMVTESCVIMRKESECSITSPEQLESPVTAVTEEMKLEGGIVEARLIAHSDGAVTNSDLEDFYSDSFYSDSSSQAGDGGDNKQGLGRRKRQKHNVAVNEVLIPLSQGWERHTRIKRGLAGSLRGLAGSLRGLAGSLRGEVLYIAPCKKKLRTYNDVQKYLSNNDIDNVNIDQFSFSNSIMVGQYFEQDLNTGQYVNMSDDVLQSKISENLQRKNNKIEVKEQIKLIKQNTKQENRDLEEDNDKEKENMSRIAVITSTKVQSPPTCSSLHDKYSSAKIPVVTSNNKSSGAYDNILRIEQQRDLQKQLIQYTLSIEEREKKEALQYAEHLQQEEQRFHRAAEQAQARRDQRDFDLQVMTVLKKPVEDLTLTDSKDYPDLSRFENCGVNEEAFADVLMIVEFLHAFGEVLKMKELPTVNKLQCVILNTQGVIVNTQGDEDRLYFLSLLFHLLPLAMKDPGFPQSKSPKNAIGQTLTAIHLTKYTITEVVRLYLIATGWTNDEALIAMQTLPVWSLQPSHKASLLGHICNELLSSTSVGSKLEENMGDIDCLRKEKWNIECQIRKIRLLEARHDMDGLEDNLSSSTQSKLKKGSDDEESEEEEMDMSVPISTENMTTEDLEKYYHKLTKKHGQMSIEIVKCGSALRTLPLGQDRYRRQYWLLGHAGGIYVEGINRKRRFIELEMDKKTYNAPSKEEIEMLAYAEQRQAEQRQPDYNTTPSASNDSSNMYSQRPRRGRPPKQRNNTLDAHRVEQLIQHQQAQQLETLLRTTTVDDLQKMLANSTSLQQPWFNLLPRQPCSTATTKLSDLKAHLEAAERERSMSQLQNALQGQNGRMGQLMQLLGGQMSPELLLLYPQLLQQLIGGESNNSLQQQLSGVEQQMTLLLQQQAAQLILAQQQELALRQAGVHPLLAAHYTQQLIAGASKDNDLKQQQIMLQALLEGSVQQDSKDSAALKHSIATKDSAAANDSAATKDSAATNDSAATKDSAALQQSMAALQQLHILAQLSGGSEDVMKQIQALTQAGLNMNDLAVLQQIENSAKECTSAHVQVKDEQEELPKVELKDSPTPTPDDSPTPTPEDYATPDEYLTHETKEFSPSSSTSIPDKESSPSLTNEMSPEMGNSFGVSGLHPLRVSGPSPPSPPIKIERDVISEGKKDDDILGIKEDDDILCINDIPTDFTLGWWRITSQATIRQILLALNSRGIRERNLQKQFHRCLSDAKDSLKVMPNNKDPKVPGCPYSSYTKDKTRSSSSEETSNVLVLPFQEGDNSPCPIAQLDLVRNVYRQLEEFKEKVLRGSLQTRDCKLHFNSLSPDANKDVSLSFSTHSEAMIACKDLLSQIESSIELRYLKAPLKTHQPILVAIPNKDEEEECMENEEVDRSDIERTEVRIAPGLRTWRTAVDVAENPSQLSICVEQLSGCIAWDKSIMKVYCQVCCKGGADHLLLLCDGCDRGFHTYCCSPALDTIPDSDWFCNKCVARNTPDDMCSVCSLKGGRQISCTKCLRNFHHTCLQPPMYKIVRGDWLCAECNKPSTNKESVLTSVSVSTKSGRGRGGRRKAEETRKRRPSTYNHATCALLLDELRTHHCAWPFLSPVDRQQFPEYYKYIKHPMDFTTISTKLTSDKYISNDELYKDIKLIFNNCHKFNEDESEVGQAGLTMRCYFEKRYQEVFK